MIILKFCALFGYVTFSVIDFISTKVKESGEPVNSVFRYDRLRCLRVHHLEYWHPE